MDAKTDVALSGAPPVRDYDKLETQISEAMAEVTFMDVLKHIFTSR